MKMSDAFDLPVIAYDIVDLLTADDDAEFYVLTKKEQAAAHAINCHDELVGLLEILLQKEDELTPTAALIKKTLMKARGVL